MDSDVRNSRTPIPVPRTGVPLGITDPVEQARAELKAALAAIEVKANVPRRVGDAVEDKVAKAREFRRREPGLAAAAVVGAAAVIGTAVWALVRAYAR
ncbi:hypothetical protein ABXJ56_05360 [Microbacterium chocolatum]|uniref:hypothetical protein n=1 Tax=Microbacterium aurantiacum TaxID=162393 RepID=UPI00338E3BB3